MCFLCACYLTGKFDGLCFADTVTCPKTQNFLWGIFRSKGDGQADMDDSATTADMEVDMVGGKMVGSIDVVVPKDQQPIMTSKDMEVDMVGGKMVGSVDVVALKDSSTTNKMSQQPIMALKDTSTPSPSRMSLQPILQLPTMTPVQQLLRITKAEYSDYQDKVRALDTAIKQILGVKSEELKDSDTSASSGTVYVCELL